MRKIIFFIFIVLSLGCADQFYARYEERDSGQSVEYVKERFRTLTQRPINSDLLNREQANPEFMLSQEVRVTKGGYFYLGISQLDANKLGISDSLYKVYVHFVDSLNRIK